MREHLISFREVKLYNHEQNRSVLAFVNFVAWVVTVGGVVAALYGAANAPEPPFGSRSGAVLTYMMPGMIIALMGLIGVALSAVGLATVDNARSNEELLTIMKRFVQQQGAQRNLASQSNSARTPAPVQPAKSPATKTVTATTGAAPSKPSAPTAELTEPGEIEYLGKTIRYDGLAFFSGGIRFQSLAKAREHIDNTTLIARR